MATQYYALSSYYSSYTKPRIQSYEQLAERILQSLGAPLIQLEITCDALMDNIAQAIEFFTKYAGFTEEYLIMSSELYTRGVGIRLDRFFGLTPEMAQYNNPDTPTLSAGYDYDRQDYRKVNSVFSFEQGISSGVSNLFTIESSLINQVFFSPMMGNYGFDVLTWHIVKEYLETRQKVYASKIYYRFDPHTQILRLLPEPMNGSPYWALLGCYVEKPLNQLVAERWVYQYARALSMISIAHVRGKYGGTPLYGGGTVNSSDLMTQGLADKDKLENELMQGISSDMMGAMPMAIG